MFHGVLFQAVRAALEETGLTGPAINNVISRDLEGGQWELWLQGGEVEESGKKLAKRTQAGQWAGSVGSLACTHHPDPGVLQEAALLEAAGVPAWRAAWVRRWEMAVRRVHPYDQWDARGCSDGG